MNANTKKLLAEMDKARTLLKEFGLTLYGFDPGVTAWTKTTVSCGSTLLNFDSAEWAWLKPILEELAQHRRKNQKDNRPYIGLIRLAEKIAANYYACAISGIGHWFEAFPSQGIKDERHKDNPQEMAFNAGFRQAVLNQDCPEPAVENGEFVRVYEAAGWLVRHMEQAEDVSEKIY